jgi:hypothetical protein
MSVEDVGAELLTALLGMPPDDRIDLARLLVANTGALVLRPSHPAAIRGRITDPDHLLFADGWNACRDAMLEAAT